jgi:outer membrane assembly lipoprotein YfiO
MRLNSWLVNFLRYSLLVIVVSFIAACAKQKRKEEMTFEELSRKALACLQKKHRDEAAEYLELIIAQHPDRTDIATYKLLLAEVYFKDGKYPSAFELFDHYNQFYPADARAEYAKYRSILAKFYQTLRADCDQTQTAATAALCKEYLAFPAYKKYTNDVYDIKKTCERKLIDKEVYVFNFYLKQGEYEAAKGRLKHLRTNYLSENQALEARLLYLESQLAQKQKNLALVKENIAKLETNYRESPFVPMTQALLTQQRFLF